MAGTETDRSLNRALLARQGLLEPLRRAGGRGRRGDRRAAGAGVGGAAVRAVVADAGVRGAATCTTRWPGASSWSGSTCGDAAPRLGARASRLPRGGRRVRRDGLAADEGAVLRRLREALSKFAKTPRTGAEIAAFADAWVDEHPGEVADEEIEEQRRFKWRPLVRWSALTRVPESGEWTSKTPTSLQTAPKQAAPPRPRWSSYPSPPAGVRARVGGGCRELDRLARPARPRGDGGARSDLSTSTAGSSTSRTRPAPTPDTPAPRASSPRSTRPAGVPASAAAEVPGECATSSTGARTCRSSRRSWSTASWPASGRSGSSGARRRSR